MAEHVYAGGVTGLLASDTWTTSLNKHLGTVVPRGNRQLGGKKFANFLGFALALRPWASPVHTSQYNRLRDQPFEQGMIHAHIPLSPSLWGFALLPPHPPHPPHAMAHGPPRGSLRQKNVQYFEWGLYMVVVFRFNI